MRLFENMYGERKSVSEFNCATSHTGMGRNGCLAPCIINLDTRYKRVVMLTPRPLFLQGKNTCTDETAGFLWAPEPIGSLWRRQQHCEPLTRIEPRFLSHPDGSLVILSGLPEGIYPKLSSGEWLNRAEWWFHVRWGKQKWNVKYLINNSNGKAKEFACICRHFVCSKWLLPTRTQSSQRDLLDKMLHKISGSVCLYVCLSLPK